MLEHGKEYPAREHFSTLLGNFIMSISTMAILLVGKEPLVYREGDWVSPTFLILLIMQI